MKFTFIVIANFVLAVFVGLPASILAYVYGVAWAGWEYGLDAFGNHADAIYKRAEKAWEKEKK